MEKVNRKAYWIVDVFLMGFVYIILRYFHVQNWNISGIDIGQHFVTSLLLSLLEFYYVNINFYFLFV